MEIAKLSIKDLKVLAYDRIFIIDKSNKELDIINQLINKKSMEPEIPVVTPEETPVETAPEAPTEEVTV